MNPEKLGPNEIGVLRSGKQQKSKQSKAQRFNLGKYSKQNLQKRTFTLEERQRNWRANPNRQADRDYVFEQILKDTGKVQVATLCIAWADNDDPLKASRFTIGKVTKVKGDRRIVNEVNWQNFRAISKSQAAVLLRACFPCKSTQKLIEDSEAR